MWVVDLFGLSCQAVAGKFCVNYYNAAGFLSLRRHKYIIFTAHYFLTAETFFVRRGTNNVSFYSRINLKVHYLVVKSVTTFVLTKVVKISVPVYRLRWVKNGIGIFL